MGIFDKDKLKNVGAGIKNSWNNAMESFHNYKFEKDENEGKPVWEDPGQSGDMKSVYDKIMGREAFQYDLNGDALYNQLRQTYAKQGQLGAMNAIGNAAALSGGFGNSYAAAAGQQAYQQSLEGLNQHIPDLYAMALQQYQAESDRLLQQYQVADSDRAFQYNKYRDDMGDWVDTRNFNYQKERDKVADQQWQAELDERSSEFQQELLFKESQAQMENQRWQKEFGYQQFLDERNYNYQKERDAEDDRRWNANYDLEMDKYLTDNSHWNAEWENKLKQQGIENALAESQNQLSWANYWSGEDQRGKDNARADAYLTLDQRKQDHTEHMDEVGIDQWNKEYKMQQEVYAHDWNHQDQREAIADQQWAAEMDQTERFHGDDQRLKWASLLGLRYG